MIKRLTLDGSTVWCFSLTHGLVDLTTALLVYNAAIVHGLAPEQAAMVTITYDIIAFAIQPLAGFFIDFLKGARIAMLAGIALIVTGIVCIHLNALLCIGCAGLGNALFHVGAGAQILDRYPSTSRAVGIFVGPGALGLGIGCWFGSQGFSPFSFLIIGLTAAFFGLALLPALQPAPASGRNMASRKTVKLGAVVLLLAAILVRGFVGRTGFAGLPTDGFVIIGLGAAACIGKMVGGIVADRAGWGRTTIIGLVVTSIGIVFVRSHIGIAFTTMILFQMTMPITLVATAAGLPGKPAFAFGLTCLALVSGTLPAYYIPKVFTQLPVTLVLIGFSMFCILAALKQLRDVREFSCIHNSQETQIV
ncbi:MAG: hypothetical protein JW863_18575 [Chitinispirillaceae bacterium]|nr:hypothetical protein [Chitinispirillaceae bacterium]